MDERTTKERLLDAAEVAFARGGYAGMSIREVAAGAECNVASANYHFGSKDGLVLAMLERRIRPLNSRRLELLEAARQAAAGATIEVEEIIEIMLRPLAEEVLLGGDREGRFMAMIARSLSDPAEVIQRAHQHFFAELKGEISKELMRHFPDISREEAGVRMVVLASCMLGAMIQLPAVMSRLFADARDLPIEGIIRYLTAFLAQGFQASLNTEETNRCV